MSTDMLTKPYRQKYWTKCRRSTHHPATLSSGVGNTLERQSYKLYQDDAVENPPDKEGKVQNLEFGSTAPLAGIVSSSQLSYNLLLHIYTNS